LVISGMSAIRAALSRGLPLVIRCDRDKEFRDILRASKTGGLMVSRVCAA